MEIYAMSKGLREMDQMNDSMQAKEQTPALITQEGQDWRWEGTKIESELEYIEEDIKTKSCLCLRPWKPAETKGLH